MRVRTVPIPHNGDMRRALALLVLPLLAVGLVGCGDDEDADEPSTTTAAPTTTAAASTTTGEPAEPVGVSVYLARGEDLGVVHREVDVTGGEVLRAALESLLGGPDGDEAGAGFGSEVPAGAELLDLAVEDGVATVDLSAEFEDGGGSASMLMRVAQVTFTATQFPTVEEVRYRIEGDDVTAIGGEGVLVDPSTRGDFEDVLPAVFVDSPAWGDTVGESFPIAGTSNTFEATHQLQLIDAGGGVFLEDFVTATAGNGVRGEWTYPGRVPVGVSGEITLRVFVISAADGSQTDEVTVALRVAGG